MIASLAASLALALAADGPSKAETFTYQVVGLFAPSREAAFREAVAKVPGVTLVSLDLDESQAVLAFDPKAVLGDAKPGEYAERIDNLVRNASKHTLGLRPPRMTPRDKLRKVEIRVAGLDCEACSLALYEIVQKVEGVELVKASFRDGLVVAWVDPARADRAKIVEALKKREVDVLMP